MRLTKSLENEYRQLYTSCEARSNRFQIVDSIVDSVENNQARYESVAASVGVPWYVIAAIHNLESSQRFDRHLHNGDKLNKRTVHVPAGRPANGEPPFTWEESAIDALKLRKLDRVSQWTLARTLFELEGYNGWGYRKFHPEIKSPYLWGFSNHYSKGKYVADGTWSETAKSKQCGAVVLIRRLEQREIIIPLVADTTTDDVFLYYSTLKVDRSEDLQRFLNTFADVSLRIDGQPGEKTSNATKRVFGFRLVGDPREN